MESFLRLLGYMRASAQVYTWLFLLVAGAGLRRNKAWYEGSLIFADSALPIICRPALKLVLPVADCSKHADTIG
jgi:hypothetical protein